MKSKIILTCMFLAASFAGISQANLEDSAKILKRQQKTLTIEKRLADNRIKLEGLQKSLADKENALDKTLDASQESANRNHAIAEDLQDNSNSKKHSRRAGKAAKQAQRAAKRARKAENRKSGVESDIKRLERKIESDEKELSKLTADDGTSK